MFEKISWKNLARTGSKLNVDDRQIMVTNLFAILIAGQCPEVVLLPFESCVTVVLSCLST